VSFLFNIILLYSSNYFIFTAAAAMPPPVELFSPPLFAAGDLVQSIPDTAPGIHPSQSVSVVGTITELKVDGGWFYNRPFTSNSPVYIKSGPWRGHTV
jgi:hypothetical protein